MHLLNFVQSHSKFFKIVTCNSSDFSSVDQNQKLGLDTSIEVALNFRRFITINSDMVKLCVLCCQVFVVLLDLFANRVPRSGEVKKCICWSKCVQVFDYIITAFTVRHYVVFSINCMNTSFCYRIA